MHSVMPAWSRNAWVSASRCERLAIATRPPAGALRAVILRMWPLGIPRARPLAASPPPGLPERRRQYHAKDRLAPFDQGNVDGELALPVNELLGAIQRIDQPERPRIDIRDMAGSDPLLRDHRYLGRQLRQARQDYGFGCLVRSGNGRSVRLRAHRHIALVVLEDHHAGAVRERDDLGQETIEIPHHCSAVKARST